MHQLSYTNKAIHDHEPGDGVSYQAGFRPGFIPGLEAKKQDEQAAGKLRASLTYLPNTAVVRSSHSQCAVYAVLALRVKAQAVAAATATRTRRREKFPRTPEFWNMARLGTRGAKPAITST